MIAPVAVGEGKTTVKSPAVLVLSPPKSIAAIALFELVELKSRRDVCKRATAGTVVRAG